jgi:NADH-quinone oxidoreductase subunit E
MLTEAEEKEIHEKLREINRAFDRKKENLIPILQRVQVELGYIPQLAMAIVADTLEIPVGEVYGVATFYNQFRLKPPGKYQIKVCVGTACHVKRSYIILEEWKRRFGIEEGDVTEDRLFSLERVACVGCCALAPVTVVGTNGVDTFHGYMMTSKVNGLIMEFERKEGHEKRE